MRPTVPEPPVERPLEVRIQGRPYAVLMRTPGRDRDLVAGFLASEGLIHSAEDLLALEPCSGPDSWNVGLAEGVPLPARATAVSSSCGACGAPSLKELMPERPPLGCSPPGELRLAEVLAALERMREGQELYRRNAGCHGAALFAPDCRGVAIDLAEDVGRHNAVDKILGARLLADDYPMTHAQALLLSGRISFELVQKAWLASIPLVVGVGMPTTFAVETAEAAGISLVGWVREGKATVFSGKTRLKA